MEEEVAPCHLVTSVLLAAGDAHWLGGAALSCLAELSRQPRLSEEGAGQAARLVASAAVGRLGQLAGCVERLQAAADADRWAPGSAGSLGAG